MNILDDIYKKSLLETEKNIKFWEEYLHNLTSLDFSVYSDKLTVPVLVPIGNKLLFRGVLKHTNEVTVALGADYFTKCSTKQAEDLRLHRIKGAKLKLEVFNKEKDHLENQILFSKGIINEGLGQDILEECSEEEDRAWRQKHKEKVKEYYQNKQKKDVEKTDISHEDLWSRLEELELQEELRNELTDENNEQDDDNKTEYDSFVIKQDNICNIQQEQSNDVQKLPQITQDVQKHDLNVNVLLQVIDRQKILEEKLAELKNKERINTNTESGLLSKLDEMEQLDELEDEMNRLDDIIQDDVEYVEDSIKKNYSANNTTRSVSFADLDNSETIEINFTHSKTDCSIESYDPESGIIKPSDIYKAYPNLFASETTSILKKSKYDNVELHSFSEHSKPEVPHYESDLDNNIKTIMLKDVIEKHKNDNQLQYSARPTSIFKKKRQQRKS